MKKILITGANSYIGLSFENYIKKVSTGDYAIDTLDVANPAWRETDFSGYDAVFHVAGIVHQKVRKADIARYYQVNRDLAREVAEKAKCAGVRQFVFLSSMSVYGKSRGVITKETLPTPHDHYGRSKWEAECAIAALDTSAFRVCILRLPMVYGKGCKGNFPNVVKIVKKFPIFPKIRNKRSAIYVDNLSAFVKLCVDRELAGVYFPQNNEYAVTVEMARIIAETLGKRRFFSILAGISVRIFFPVVGAARKAFGTLIYEGTEDFAYEYCVVDFAESVRRSV